MNKFFNYLRGLIGHKTCGTFDPLNLHSRTGGPTFKHITIDKSGDTHTSFFGGTSYGKGHVPLGGHKPITTINISDSPSTNKVERQLDNNMFTSIKDSLK